MFIRLQKSSLFLRYNRCRSKVGDILFLKCHMVLRNTPLKQAGVKSKGQKDVDTNICMFGHAWMNLLLLQTDGFDVLPYEIN